MTHEQATRADELARHALAMSEAMLTTVQAMCAETRRNIEANDALIDRLKESA